MRVQNGMWVALLLVVAASATPQNANITRPVAELEQLMAADPLVITAAQISRPKATGDITLRAEVAFGGAAPLRVKLRHAEPGADTFNNVPRYDLAAYALQKLFLDPADYVVPPTTVRMIPRKDLLTYAPRVLDTFPGADQVMAVIQYWLTDVTNAEDILDTARFAADPAYARHIGQLNLFTYLIDHRDSNLGNFLIARAQPGARVFSIDNGVAFGSEGADRGELWHNIRVDRLPADAVARLRTLTPQVLEQHLAVLAQLRLESGAYVPVSPGANLFAVRGVRRAGNVVQMGLTSAEIRGVSSRLERLLKQIDAGKYTLVEANGH